MIANENLEKERRIDLEISVKNFGPIIGGEVKLRPLTVLIGPNNSGKSYVAMLFHSLFR
ncbi:MAG: AAA family ATPase, partial [Archaeoglobaceae archaeon]